MKVKELIKKNESQTLEFKKSLADIDRIVEVIASFANSDGGILLAGVSNNGEVIGINIGSRTIEGLINKITDNIDPVIYPKITVEVVDGKNIILIEVEKSFNKPHLAYGRPFKRVGKVTKLMKRDEYELLLKKRSEVEFDGELCENATYDDLSLDAIKEFKKKYEYINKKIVSSDLDLLESLKCVKRINGNLKITNAGILLFGKNPVDFFMNSYITIVRYPGVKVGSAHLDMKDIHGNIFELIDKADAYVREHIQVISRLKEGQIAREDIPIYPFFVIRELIVNAVAHRDYANFGSRIIIKIFQDRIEFFSPGGLPNGITPKNILTSQFSRNPIIAKVLNKIQYIEEIGEGWNRIMDTIKTHPLKSKLPDIEDIKTAVIVTIYAPSEETIMEIIGNPQGHTITEKPLWSIKMKINEQSDKKLGITLPNDIIRSLNIKKDEEIEIYPINKDTIVIHRLHT